MLTRPALFLAGNTFDGAGAELFKIQDSDTFTFTGGSIRPGALTKGPSSSAHVGL